MCNMSVVQYVVVSVVLLNYQQFSEFRFLYSFVVNNLSPTFSKYTQICRYECIYSILVDIYKYNNEEKKRTATLFDLLLII